MPHLLASVSRMGAVGRKINVIGNDSPLATLALPVVCMCHHHGSACVLGGGDTVMPTCACGVVLVTYLLTSAGSVHAGEWL